MDSNHRNNRVSPRGYDPVPRVNRFAERGRHYFGRHLNLARETFPLESVWRETDLNKPRETDIEAGPARPEGERTSGQLTDPYPVSAEDIRLHAKLVERLMLVHYGRNGLWARIRRFLFGNRLIRWLVRPMDAAFYRKP